MTTSPQSMPKLLLGNLVECLLFCWSKPGPFPNLSHFSEFSLSLSLFFFLLWIILKSLLNLLHHCFCFLCFSFFWPWGMWVFSSLTRDWTHTPCVGRWSLNHWTTRDVPQNSLFFLCLTLSFLMFPLAILIYSLKRSSLPISLHSCWFYQLVSSPLGAPVHEGLSFPRKGIWVWKCWRTPEGFFPFVRFFVTQ